MSDARKGKPENVQAGDHSTKFWSRLGKQTGPNLLGPINYDDHLNATRNIEENTGEPQGVIQCCAIFLGETQGYRITKCTCPASKTVYWLPYVSGAVTFVDRADYEGSCDFFLTALFSGCRFALERDRVMHIARNVLSNESRGGRENAMQKHQTGDTRPRTASMDDTNMARFVMYSGDAKYHGTSFVCGINMGHWKYMICEKVKDPASGQWHTL